MIEALPLLIPIVVPTTLFVSVAAAIILRGPLGKALGERISGHKLDGESSVETEALHADVDELRGRLAEVEERLDFTERMLAQQKNATRIPGGE